MDRRARFFLIAAVACFAMVPVGVEKFRDVAVIAGIVYIALAVLSMLDKWSRGRPHKR
jgi:hypothetical protein